MAQLTTLTVLFVVVPICHCQEANSDIFHGTYEFEILGSPKRFYICQRQDDTDTLYWAGSDLQETDYTYIVGRDADGITMINAYLFEAECEIFRLYGGDILTGYWKIRYSQRRNEYTLYERFPDLHEIEDDEWNTYILTKISTEIVAEPEMRGLQCFAPDPNFPIVQAFESPQCWTSSLLRPEQLIAHQFFNANDESCWTFATGQGYVVRGGYNYDFREEWDGNLLILRWDDQINSNDVGSVGLYHCLRGSMFVVRTAEDSAIFSYQCEDRVTGNQYLTSLEDADVCEKLSCPLWIEDKSMHKVMMLSRNPTAVPTLNPSVPPTIDHAASDCALGIVECEQSPCSIHECSAYPSATCVNNYCGGCNAVFYDQSGDELSEEQCSRDIAEVVPTMGPTVLPTLQIPVDETSDFNQISYALEKCVGDQFESYLTLFKDEQVTDDIVPLLDDDDWNELIKELGFKICVKNTFDNLA